MAEAAIDVIDIGPYLAGDPAGTRRVVARREGGVRADRLPRHRGPRRPGRAGAPGLRRVDGLLRPAAGERSSPCAPTIRASRGATARWPARASGAPTGSTRRPICASSSSSARSTTGPAHFRALPGRGQGLRPERVARAPGGAPRGLHRVLPGPGAARPRPDAHLRAGARPARGLVRRRDRPPLQHLSEQPVSRAVGRAAAGPAPHGPAHGFRKPHDPGGERCARRPSGAVPRRRVARRAPGARASSSSTSAT